MELILFSMQCVGPYFLYFDSYTVKGFVKVDIDTFSITIFNLSSVFYLSENIQIFWVTIHYTVSIHLKGSGKNRGRRYLEEE